jgi:VIT1/CCC1 family predicted Fe2+/Mn2+ transporter
MVEQEMVIKEGPFDKRGPAPSSLEAAVWVVFIGVSIPAIVFLLGYWLTSDLSEGAFQAALLGMLALQVIGLIRSVRSTKRFNLLATVLVGLLVAGALFMTIFALWFSMDEKPLVQNAGPAQMISLTVRAPHDISAISLG